MRLAPLLVGYVLLSTSGLLLLRRTLDVERSPGDTFLEKVLTPGAAFGAVLYVASFVLWLVTLQRYPVTTVYPVFVGAGFVGVALGGWLVLGERFDAVRALGALVVLVGIVLLAR
jgi:multidrug transporter EmrE-like cation transporter